MLCCVTFSVESGSLQFWNCISYHQKSLIDCVWNRGQSFISPNKDDLRKEGEKVDNERVEEGREEIAGLKAE